MILSLLFQIALLSWPMVALAEAPPPPLAKPGCHLNCGNNVTIPYPFGIGPDCYIDPWFEIYCNSSKPFMRNTTLEVLEISVSNNTMRVNHPIFKICKGRSSGNDTVLFGNYTYDYLENTPFVYSQSNRFTGLGCENLAYMRDIDKSIIGGCFSVCDEKNSTVEKGCYGMRCCQTRIPSFLKVINTLISTLNFANGSTRIPAECKFAFLVDQNWFENEKNLRNPQDVQNMIHVPVVLDWGIFDFSFYSNATKKSATYNSTSHCKDYDSTDYTTFQTVQCYCKLGFEGNPYLLQGCQDIDECILPNACERNMTCVNANGTHHCLPIFIKKSKINMIFLGFGIAIGSLFLFIGAWWLSIIIKRRKTIKLKEKYFKQNGGFLLQEQLSLLDGSIDGSKLFDSKELDKATDHFNVNRILGQGGQGTVYKGMLSDGRIVAVKKSKEVDERKVQDFINEVVILSQINHRNVVKLLGCCLESKVPLLVYEFIPNGTLFQYLHDQNEELPLTWSKRLQIATEVAGALFYLHSAASIPIYHRDIKSTNILLDEKYRAKVADFGTSRSISIDQTHVTTKVQGTLGYLDPEYFQSSQFTDKSDVYSFGVVLVELLTGQKAISSTRSQQGRSLATYFILSMKENRLYDILDAQVIKLGKKKEIMAIANLAKRCLNLNGKKRPTMKEVAMELEGIGASSTNIKMQQSFQEIDYEGTEFEAWDVGSTLTSTNFYNSVPLVDDQPLLTNS